MAGQTLTALIHGDAGVGKSWLGATTPTPRLILDAEGRARYLPSEKPKILWDPAHNAPPADDGTWDTCVAIVPDVNTMDVVLRHLKTGLHPFKSVTVDSLMEIQKRMKDDIAGSVAGLTSLEQRDWNTLLVKLERLVRDYRDLTISAENPTDCVIFTVGSREIGGKMRPLLQGAMATQVPYFIDIVGYLYVTHSPEDPANPTRSLLVAPGHPLAVAKDGTDKLPRPAVQNPNLGQIYTMLNGGPPVAAVDSLPPMIQTPEQPLA